MPVLKQLRSQLVAQRNRGTNFPSEEPGSPKRRLGKASNQDELGKFSLLPAIREQDNKVVKSRRVDTQGYMHLSTFVKHCPRRAVLTRDSDDDQSGTVLGSMRIVWEMGRGVERHIRGQYIKAVNREGIYGVWKCKCGKQKQTGFYRDRKACPSCGTKSKEYHELTVFDNEGMIVSNPDFLVLDGEGMLVPVEIKSINKEDFNKLEAPNGDNMNQLVGYWINLKDHGPDNVRSRLSNYVIIIYANKDFTWSDDPYKEYRVKLSQVQSMVNAYHQLRDTRISTLHDPEIMPERRLCAKVDKGPAKECPVAVRCFSMR